MAMVAEILSLIDVLGRVTQHQDDIKKVKQEIENLAANETNGMDNELGLCIDSSGLITQRVNIWKEHGDLFVVSSSLSNLLATLTTKLDEQISLIRKVQIEFGKLKDQCKSDKNYANEHKGVLGKLFGNNKKLEKIFGVYCNGVKSLVDSLATNRSNLELAIAEASTQYTEFKNDPAIKCGLRLKVGVLREMWIQCEYKEFTSTKKFSKSFKEKAMAVGMVSFDYGKVVELLGQAKYCGGNPKHADDNSHKMTVEDCTTLCCDFIEDTNVLESDRMKETQQFAKWLMTKAGAGAKALAMKITEEMKTNQKKSAMKAAADKMRADEIEKESKAQATVRKEQDYKALEQMKFMRINDFSPPPAVARTLSPAARAVPSYSAEPPASPQYTRPAPRTPSPRSKQEGCPAVQANNGCRCGRPLTSPNKKAGGGKSVCGLHKTATKFEF